MVLDDRVLGELLGCLFEQAHSFEIGVLLVIDPAQSVRDIGIILPLLARGLGIVQGKVNVAPAFAQDPGQIVGSRRELGIQLQGFLIPALGLLVLIALLVDGSKDHMRLQKPRVLR